MELSKLQEEIVNSDEKYVAVVAAAAAGKTRVLTEHVRMMLRRGIDPEDIAVITFTTLAASELRERLAADYRNGMYIGTIHGLAYRFLLDAGHTEVREYVEDEKFDEFFALLNKYPTCVRHIPHILLDESQDTTPEEFQFIFKMIKPDTYFLVGDVRQCQPEGTKILMCDGTEKNIEDLKIGDAVVSYDMHKSYVYRGFSDKSRKVLIKNINSRTLNNEKLIKVYTTDGHSSTYTFNHRVIANLCRFSEYNYLTYLMCDENNRFRVGVSQFRNSTTGPWRAKMLAENCSKIWILDTFKTNKEARILEDKISYKYQIPQLTFQLDKTTYTQKDIDYIYEGLNTFESAKRCLIDYNKNINFPFAQKGDNNHYATNAFNEVYACNILPHNMKMMIYSNSGKPYRISSDIEKIEYIDGNNIKVYSLDVEDFHTYVADGIFTHNSIFGFKGCSPDFFMNIMYKPDVKVYNLNENYRNCDEILSFAKEILANGEMHDNSVAMQHGGKVIHYPTVNYTDLIKYLSTYGEWSDWAILSPKNDGVAEIMSILKQNGIPCITFKQKGLKKEDIDRLLQQNAVKVLTCHSAKGLEFDYVAMIRPEWWGNREERIRLYYVPATRARKILVWMGSAKPLKNYRKKKKTF